MYIWYENSRTIFGYSAKLVWAWSFHCLVWYEWSLWLWWCRTNSKCNCTCNCKTNN